MPLVRRSDFYLPAQIAVHLLFTSPINAAKKPHQLSWVSRFKRQQQELGGKKKSSVISHQSSVIRKFGRTCNVRDVTDLKVKEERRRLASATRARKKKEEVRGKKTYTASFLAIDILC